VSLGFHKCYMLKGAGGKLKADLTCSICILARLTNIVIIALVSGRVHPNHPIFCMCTARDRICTAFLGRAWRHDQDWHANVSFPTCTTKMDLYTLVGIIFDVSRCMYICIKHISAQVCNHVASAT
jgi:hypothetical protein